MADRSLVYRLRADIAHYAAGMRAAKGIMVDFTDQATRADRQSEKFRRGLDQFGGAAGRVGLVAAAGLGAAVATAANFDAAMSKVNAATHESVEGMQALREAAIQAGAETVFSASGAAQAIEELAKAGVSTADILGGGLDGALDLAAAGSLEVGRAAEIAATALNQFQLGGDDMAHVADLLSAAAGKAQGSVDDLAYALKYAGVPANALGISIEETTAVLGEFAAAGILGEQAGTTLRGILVSLAAESGPAQKAMEDAGLSFYDTQGRFIGLAGAAEELQSKLAGATEAERNNTLVRIFGRESLQGAITLYQGGGEAVAEWTQKVNDSGYAADTAARNLDNLKGDLEAFKGSLETALIGTGEGAQGPLRALTQAATDAVNAFNGLPSSAQNVATGLLAITAVTGGAAWFGSKVVQNVAQTRAALEDLGTSGSKVAGKLGTAAKALGGLTVAVVAYQTAIDALNIGTSGDDIRRSAELIEARAGEDVQAKIDATTAAIKRYDEQARKGVSLNLGITTLFSDQGAADAADLADGLRKRLAELEHQKELQEAASEGAAASEDALTSSITRNTVATDNNVRSMEDQLKAMRKAREERLAALDAELAYESALDAASESIKTNGKNFDITTEKGRDNRQALYSVADAWNNLSNRAQNAPGAFKRAQDSFIQLARDMGASRDEARRLARQILDLPSKKVRVEADVDPARRNLSLLDTYLDQVTRPRRVQITASTNALLADQVTSAQRRASGGYITGPGTGTSDSIPAWLSNGEYVINARATARHRALLEAINSNRYASGGYVGSGPSFPSTMGLSAGDIAALAQAVASARPIYGDVTVIGDGSFERQARQRKAWGGVR